MALLSRTLAFGERSVDWRDTTETIERDVVVIGGGSSGTYSAVRLQAMGKSVALIEKQNRLGGHVNTYVDPTTKKTFDYGVIIFVNISVVHNYFNHLDVPLGAFTSFVHNETTLYADFEKGTPVSAAAFNQGNATEAYAGYQTLLEKYSYLANGFNLPDPVPEELLMPYGALLEKYKLDPIAYQAFYIDEGAGNVLAQPAIYMLKYFGLLQNEGAVSGYATEATHNNQALCTLHKTYPRVRNSVRKY